MGSEWGKNAHPKELLPVTRRPPRSCFGHGWVQGPVCVWLCLGLTAPCGHLPPAGLERPRLH